MLLSKRTVTRRGTGFLTRDSCRLLRAHTPGSLAHANRVSGKRWLTLRFSAVETLEWALPGWVPRVIVSPAESARRSVRRALSQSIDMNLAID